MQQMLRYGLTVVFLLIGTWQDIKTRKIEVGWLFFFGTIGILINIIFHAAWQIWITGMIPGLVILLFAKFSGEQIGYGDGLIITVTGLFLTGIENISLFLVGLFLCAICTIVLFFTGKVERKTTLPFVQFLMAAFLIQILSLIIV